MSHFTELKTNLTNERILKQALEKMGFQIESAEEGVKVRGYFGETLNADFKVLTRTHYDIGFKKNAQGNYELVADWELMPRVSGIEQAPFAAALKKEYARMSISEIAKERGYDIQCVEDETNQSLEMVVTQW